jgi:hypothetical protein
VVQAFNGHAGVIKSMRSHRYRGARADNALARFAFDSSDSTFALPSQSTLYLRSCADASTRYTFKFQWAYTTVWVFPGACGKYSALKYARCHPRTTWGHPLDASNPIHEGYSFTVFECRKTHGGILKPNISHRRREIPMFRLA